MVRRGLEVELVMKAVPGVETGCGMGLAAGDEASAQT